MNPFTTIFEAVLVLAGAGLAFGFRPFAVLRQAALRPPWFAALVILPLAWFPLALLPGSLLQFSFACLLVLMFGWPLAVCTLLIVAALASLLYGGGAIGALGLAAWNGVVPATFALLAGIAVRRFLPAHVFVYILGRGFFATVVAILLSGMLAILARPLPPGPTAPTLVVGYWLIAWGEGTLTGMLTAIFVAFRPGWLLTWSDLRYLRPPNKRADPPDSRLQGGPK